VVAEATGLQVVAEATGLQGVAALREAEATDPQAAEPLREAEAVMAPLANLQAVEVMAHRRAHRGHTVRLQARPQGHLQRAQLRAERRALCLSSWESAAAFC
jgi:hypothetical protein